MAKTERKEQEQGGNVNGGWGGQSTHTERCCLFSTVPVPLSHKRSQTMITKGKKQIVTHWHKLKNLCLI